MQSSVNKVVVNLLWCVPGQVGGSEEYLVRQLLGLAEQPERRWNPTAAVARGFKAAHPELVGVASIVLCVSVIIAIAFYIARADTSLPVVVLVDKSSASASEIVSAALKESHRATIIGQPTYGKNTVQVWAPLVNDGGVRITISRWFTPDHHSVAPDGVQPDIKVEIPDGTPPDQDLVLQRAIQQLTTPAAPAASLSWLRDAA